jgi:hypothetical protein
MRAMQTETSANPLDAAHRVVCAVWRSITDWRRAGWQEALIRADEADLSDLGRRIRRKALYDIRDRQRRRQRQSS